MNVSVPLGLWLVALAATGFVTVTALAAIRSSTDRAAAGRVTAAVIAWLAVDVALGSAGVFTASATTVVPLIALGLAVPIVAGIWLLTRPGSARRFADSIPLHRLIGVQVYRAAGVIFLIAWATGRMPAIFALPAGVGDIAVGVAAPFVAARLRAKGPNDERAWRGAVAWNVLGIADLVVAVALGFFTSPSAFQLLALDHANVLITRMPYVLIPTFAVPLSILFHVVALRRLRASEPAVAPPVVSPLSNEFELRFAPERRLSGLR